MTVLKKKSDRGSKIIAAWNRGALSANVFLRKLGSLANSVFRDFEEPDRRYLEIRNILDPLRGRKKFDSVEHLQRWLRVASDRRAESEALAKLQYQAYEIERDEHDRDIRLPLGLTASAGPVSVLGLPLNILAIGDDMNAFRNNLEVGLEELRAARLSEAESRLAALRTVGGLGLSEAAEQLKLPTDVAREMWSRAATKLARILPPDFLPSDDAAQLVTFVLADTMLLEQVLRTPNLLSTLSWRDFEKALSLTLEKIGFEIELRRGTKDGGIDILALKRAEPFGVHRYLVQAKRYTSRVGVSVVRELLFLHGHHRVTKSCLATTSSFTRGAWQLAKEYEWQLELKDRERLLEWIRLALKV